MKDLLSFEEFVLTETTLPTTWDDAVDMLMTSLTELTKGSQGYGARLKTKLKLLKGYWFYMTKFDGINNRLIIQFKIENGENLNFEGNSQVRSALKSLFETSGLNVSLHSSTSDLAIFVEIPQKLDRSSFSKVKKAISLITAKQLDKTIKELFGDIKPTEQRMEDTFKEYKLKIESKRDIGVFAEWVFKTKNPESDFAEIKSKLRAQSSSSSSTHVTTPFAFGKYLTFTYANDTLTAKSHK